MYVLYSNKQPVQGDFNYLPVFFKVRLLYNFQCESYFLG